MEFFRAANIGFEESIRMAADLGYHAVEPVIHTGWDQFAEVRYSPAFTTEEDPLLMRDICDAVGIEVGAISGHSPLMRPEAAVPRLTKAIQLAAATGARVVTTNEKHRPEWMDDDQAWEVMRYTLKVVNLVAQRYGIHIGIEQDGEFTRTTAGLLRIADLVPSPWIGLTWDTGNAYLAGTDDPYDALELAVPRIRHVHLKDLETDFATRNRGRMSSAITGCAIGEGVMDWERIFSILGKVDRPLTLSVQCSSVEQAASSLEFLTTTLGSAVTPRRPHRAHLTAVE